MRITKESIVCNIDTICLKLYGRRWEASYREWSRMSIAELKVKLTEYERAAERKGV